MFQIRQALFVIIVLFISSSVCKSQTRDDFSRKYGEPKKEFYLIKPGILIKAEYGNNGQVDKLKVFLDKQNIFGHNQVKFIERELALEIIEALTATRRIGKFTSGITFSAGCTSIENSNYKNVQIGNVLVCFPNEISEIISIHIRWKN